MTRVVVFDFDGTLVDSNDIKQRAFHEVARCVPGGVDIIEATLAELPGGTRYQVFAAAAARLCPGDEMATERLAQKFVASYTTLASAGAAACPEVPGATAAMVDLAAGGALLAVNSGTPTDALRDIIDRRRWSGHFRCIYGAPASKVENLGWIATDLHVDSRDMVMVGDRDVDFRAANAFGCAFVALVRPDSDFSEQVPRSLCDLGGLPTLLASLAG